MKLVIDIDEKDYKFIKSVRSIMKNSDTFQRIAADLFRAVHEAEAYEENDMVTTHEFLEACDVLNTFCKEHNAYCGDCPMIGVCRVGVPNVNSNNDTSVVEVD